MDLPKKINIKDLYVTFCSLGHQSPFSFSILFQKPVYIICKHLPQPRTLYLAVNDWEHTRYLSPPFFSSDFYLFLVISYSLHLLLIILLVSYLRERYVIFINSYHCATFRKRRLSPLCSWARRIAIVCH